MYMSKNSYSFQLWYCWSQVNSLPGHQPIRSFRSIPAKYEKQVLTYNGQTIKVRAYEKIVYVANPVEKGYEIMNIYVPEEYFNGGSINGYTAKECSDLPSEPDWRYACCSGNR